MRRWRLLCSVVLGKDKRRRGRGRAQSQGLARELRLETALRSPGERSLLPEILSQEKVGGGWIFPVLICAGARNSIRPFTQQLISPRLCKEQQNCSAGRGSLAMRVAVAARGVTWLARQCVCEPGLDRRKGISGHVWRACRSQWGERSGTQGPAVVLITPRGRAGLSKGGVEPLYCPHPPLLL